MKPNIRSNGLNPTRDLKIKYRMSTGVKLLVGLRGPVRVYAVSSSCSVLCLFVENEYEDDDEYDLKILLKFILS